MCTDWQTSQNSPPSKKSNITVPTLTGLWTNWNGKKNPRICSIFSLLLPPKLYFGFYNFLSQVHIFLFEFALMELGEVLISLSWICTCFSCIVNLFIMYRIFWLLFLNFFILFNFFNFSKFPPLVFFIRNSLPSLLFLIYLEFYSFSLFL